MYLYIELSIEPRSLFGKGCKGQSSSHSEEHCLVFKLSKSVTERAKEPVLLNMENLIQLLSFFSAPNEIGILLELIDRAGEECDPEKKASNDNFILDSKNDGV